METATAPATRVKARFAAFAHAAPILLTDVEDLHDVDQDAVLRDRLADTQSPAAYAREVTRLLAQPGRAALLAHELSNRAAFLTR